MRQGWKIDVERRDDRCREDETRDAIRHDADDIPNKAQTGFGSPYSNSICLAPIRPREEKSFVKYRDKQQLRIGCMFPRTRKRDLIRSANGLTTADHDHTLPVPEP
jgi:hypothetical protein